MQFVSLLLWRTLASCGNRGVCSKVEGMTPSHPIRVIELGLACCGVEASAVDLVSNAGHPVEVAHGIDGESHILVIAGTVTYQLAAVITDAYSALSKPKVVVAFGACAITGGPYWDSYSVISGADHIVPIDIHVPGCPPRPEDLARALVQAEQLVQSCSPEDSRV